MYVLDAETDYKAVVVVVVLLLIVMFLFIFEVHLNSPAM